MGYSIQNRIEVSVFINDKEYPLDKNNVLNYLHIAATVVTKAPALSFSVTDVTNTIPRLGLQDGAPIRIVVKALKGETHTYKFRKFNHQQMFNGSAHDYIISGIWDNVTYWNTTSFSGVNGTSSDVLRAIADKCRFTFDGDVTNDSQLWLPKNQSNSSFARTVASHGFLDSKSCMVLGLDLDNTLIYKNVNKVSEGKYKLLAYQDAKDSITVADFKVDFKSGFNNLLSGYHNMRYAQSTTQEQTQEVLDTLAFASNSRNPDYNRKVKERIARGQVRFGPIDVGNVHRNYEKASYQNARYKALFSTNIELLIPMSTPIKLLDTVNFSSQKENGSKDTVSSGVYTISGKAIYIQGATYAEKLVGCRHGTNEPQIEN